MGGDFGEGKCGGVEVGGVELGVAVVIREASRGGDVAVVIHEALRGGDVAVVILSTHDVEDTAAAVTPDYTADAAANYAVAGSPEQLPAAAPADTAALDTPSA